MKACVRVDERTPDWLCTFPMTLAELGWTDTLAQAFAPHAAPGVEPARVVVELRRHYYAVQTATGEFLGELTGKFHHGADREAQAYPAVGDWVAVQVSSDGRRAQIHALLPRRTRFSRQAAGEAQDHAPLVAVVDDRARLGHEAAVQAQRRVESGSPQAGGEVEVRHGPCGS